MAEPPGFRVLIFRWGRDRERGAMGWERLPEVRFTQRASAEGYARLRVESRAVSGTAVLADREDGNEPEILSHYGRLPENLEI